MNITVMVMVNLQTFENHVFVSDHNVSDQACKWIVETWPEFKRANELQTVWDFLQAKQEWHMIYHVTTV